MLTSLATELGLEGESLRRALETRQFEKSVLDDEQEAGVLGLTGVPAFVANRRAAAAARDLPQAARASTVRRPCYTARA